MLKNIKTSLLIVLVSITSLYAQIEPLLPTPTGSGEAAAIDGKIYCFGGDANPLSEYFNGLEKFDPFNNQWEKKSNMNFGRHSLRSVVIDGKIYAIGGHIGNSVAVNESYDPISDSWAILTQMPTGRSSFGIAKYENSIFCIGGNSSGSYTDKVEKYYVSLDSWETKQALPETRNLLTATTFNDKIFVFCGYNTSNEIDGKVFIYNIDTDSWSHGNQQLIPTANSKSILVGDKIFVVGGYDGEGNLVKSIQIYDPQTDSWSFGSDLLWGRVEPDCVIIDSYLYIIGGSPSSGFTSISKLDISGLVSVKNKAVKNIGINNFHLYQNYPNPFNPSTLISFYLVEDNFVQLKIYNNIGQEIETIFQGNLTGGKHQYMFNANKLSSGTYFCQLKAGEQIATKKMILLK
ncbi:MAG: T9SS type A sorting domain-containing protein [Melioribacteraceae bacterium]|nr:T9SS type A sorting domain-containing protein [Melioribacteraceae bacterium]MCF8355997.1 T9SS type A sorting domain-containing protein [Melioribacteraceae bacterium]MCF8396111.1 T9SS type A sorting domain-containing protein [Melioribacteraceae bacterium]MCF8419594.1 T9SS type A sorting domain-containing protein [Melioribacteraceae bacterium]